MPPAMSTPLAGRPSHRSPGLIGKWLLGLAVILLLPTTVVFVDETEFVIVERLGRIVAVYDRADDRGWQWKAPWPIDAVRRFDRRVQLLTPPGREVFTADRKNLVVEPFVCWRIAESPADAGPLADRPVVRFFRSLQTPAAAESRLATRLQSVLTTEFGRRPMNELLVVRDAVDDATVGPLEQLAAAIRSSVQQQPDELESWTGRLGIVIDSLALRRINLPAGNQQAVYERMRSERQRMAERYRSAGQAESVLIRSQAERLAGEALARAKADADRIRAAGEAEALRTLNAAYAQDPEFAQRLAMLDAYRQMLTQQTTLVMSADSPLWKLLTSAGTSSSSPTTDPPASALRPQNTEAAP
jgi:membrane protease subunit HflC